jgi:hypothetical protein
MPVPVPATADFVASIYGSSFGGMPAPLVASALTSAAKRTGNLYPSDDLAQEAVFMRAAILLLKHPQARALRLANPDQIFVWESELLQHQNSSVMGLRVF